MPESSGIYQFLDKKNEILYVGKAKNLKNRVSSYFSKSIPLEEKTRQLVGKIHLIKIVKTQSEIESFLLEAELIKKIKPFYNIKMTDDKSYIFIRITLKYKYPAILLSRQNNDKKSIYFGRFPNSGSVKNVLKTLRKIFPYQNVLNHPKKKCLYNHIGLCPCPPVLTIDELTEYKKNVKHIIQFLKGNTKKVLRDLEKERNEFSKIYEFEKAQEIQQKINAINYVTTDTRNPFDYQINPNLEEDLRKNHMENLVKVLSENGVSIKTAQRIECYDISNISGTLATGSMVVFENGEKNGNEYRRFKIKRTKGPNDFAMMKEVLQRRLKNDWKLPDLFIIDGGKGQLSSVVEVLNELKINIPAVGLAKRLETIITSDGKEILLPRSSEALKLVMRIRDEAHRFAVTYHRKLRSKNLTGNIKAIGKI